MEGLGLTWEGLEGAPQATLAVANMSKSLSNAGVVSERLGDNGIHFLNVGQNEMGQDCLYFGTVSDRGESEVSVAEMSIS